MAANHRHYSVGSAGRGQLLWLRRSLGCCDCLIVVIRGGQRSGGCTSLEMESKLAPFSGREQEADLLPSLINNAEQSGQR